MNWVREIQQLKAQKKALIISHYYQEAEIQDLADYVGDSLGMAQFAQKSNAPLVVVCGVRFMAESIKAMNMDKVVLLPDLNAGCSLADTCTAQVFAHFKANHPHDFVMTYVNSSLEVKAMSDVICTSSNAVKIAQKIPADKKILFGPDQHLGRYVAKQTGREMVLFPGNCFIHTAFSAEAMFKLKIQHPQARIVAHPECEEVVLNHADYIGSTSQLIEFTKTNSAECFIVMTEPGVIHQMQRLSPHKIFLAGPDLAGCACNVCPHMRLNTLEKIHQCLATESPEIHIDPELAKAALKPLAKMMELTAS